MSGRGVRVLTDYDREFGVIVAGTEDVGEALPLAVAYELEEQGLSIDDTDEESVASKAHVEEWMRRNAAPGWRRIVPSRGNHWGYSWWIAEAAEGERGAFKSVEFRR